MTSSKTDPLPSSKSVFSREAANKTKAKKRMPTRNSREATVACYTAPYNCTSKAPYHTAPYYIIPYNTVPSTVPYRTIYHVYTVLHRTISYTKLYHIVLYHNGSCSRVTENDGPSTATLTRPTHAPPNPANNSSASLKRTRMGNRTGGRRQGR